MPLDKSGSKKSVGENINTEESAGRPKSQAIAIALNTQREAKSKKKGHAHVPTPGYARKHVVK